MRPFLLARAGKSVRPAKRGQYPGTWSQCRCNTCGSCSHWRVGPLWCTVWPLTGLLEGRSSWRCRKFPARHETKRFAWAPVTYTSRGSHWQMTHLGARSCLCYIREKTGLRLRQNLSAKEICNLRLRRFIAKNVVFSPKTRKFTKRKTCMGNMWTVTSFDKAGCHGN